MVFTGRLPEVYQEMVREMNLSDTVCEVGHLPQDEVHPAAEDRRSAADHEL